MTRQYFLSQAAYCRRLAETTSDPRSRRNLLQLAEEYRCEANQIAGETDAELKIVGSRKNRRQRHPSMV